MKFTYPSGSRPLEGYMIKRGIGIGGFGEVYFATSDAGKEVALKRIQRNLDVELRGVTQCLNLKHSNLVALYDIKYDAEGEAWVVMEYVAGETLKEELEKFPDGMSQSDAIRWFRGIASGVTYLHDHGIVHRDLKPGNIFLDDGAVKIGDYGLSKFMSCSRRSGQTESVGTFHYMAPEIGKGVYGKEIDVYALGIILHEMLTGRVPFDGETSQEIIMKHLTADPDLSGLGEPFASVIRRALAKDPEQRYRAVPDMVAALDGHTIPVSAPMAAAAKNQKSAADVLVIDDAPSLTARTKSEPMYIGEESPPQQQEMFFGPLREGPSARGAAPGKRVPPVAKAAARPAATASEPIARAVQHGWRQFQTTFEDTPHGSVLKVLILVGAAILIAVNAEIFLPLAVVLGVFYLIYYGVRLIVLGDNGRSRRAQLHVTRQQQLTQARRDCAAKPVGQRVAELSGSFLASSGTVAALSALMLLVVGQSFSASLSLWSMYSWLVITGTLGAWMLLLCGKCWEGHEGQGGARRLVCIVLALGLGGVSYAVAEFLQLNLHDLARVDGLPDPMRPDGWYGASGAPLLPVFLVYFAALFALPRWWRGVDPMRRTRVSLVAALFVGVWAWVLHMVLYFSWPLGIMLAILISLAAQLSAPWMDWKRITVRTDG